MPKFLNREELYRLIQRELPENAYPDGAPSAFFSTADSDSTADVAATGYSTLERIYDNYFPQSANEKIDDWEIFVFGKIINSNLTLSERQEKVVVKLRERKDMSLWTMLVGVLEFLPFGTSVQIFEQCDTFDNCWKLSVSKLGNGTFLGCTHRIILNSFDAYCHPSFYYWTLGVSKLGVNTRLAPKKVSFDPNKLSSRAWHRQQFKAYGYGVYVFEHTLTMEERDNISSFLNAQAPARSSFYIVDNADFVTRHRTVIQQNVDRIDNFDTVFKDVGSTTGYSGRKDIT